MPSKSLQDRCQYHGLHKLRRELDAHGLPDRTTPLGQLAHEWRDALIRDLGGEDVVSVQQRALADLATRQWLLVAAVDDFVVRMPSPVNKRSRSCSTS